MDVCHTVPVVRLLDVQLSRRQIMMKIIEDPLVGVLRTLRFALEGDIFEKVLDVVV
jgi:hypothetical protein